MFQQNTDKNAIERQLRELNEQLTRAELQGQAFCDAGVRMYLERKIRELDAELAFVGEHRVDAARERELGVSRSTRDLSAVH